jgi:hypothetical protein
MRARGLLVVACTLAAPWAAFAQPASGPVETTVRYYEASEASRCKEVWGLYSKAMQGHIRSDVAQSVHARGSGGAEIKPEEARCWKDGAHQRLDARLVGMQGDRATVAVIMRGRISRGRWDTPGEMTQWTEEVRLVREGGAWKIDGPRSNEEKLPGVLLDAAEVRVRISPTPEPGRHQVLEAMAISRVSRDALDAVLVDPQAWAAALPSFKAIEPLERSGKVGRARLAFADPATAIPVTVRVSGKPNNAKAGFTSLFWDVEQELKAPVYMRGEWYLGANNDGTTRVKLTIVIDPRHWPGSERLFSAQRMADALVELEKAAAKR